MQLYRCSIGRRNPNPLCTRLTFEALMRTSTNHSLVAWTACLRLDLNNRSSAWEVSGSTTTPPGSLVIFYRRLKVSLYHIANYYSVLTQIETYQNICPLLCPDGKWYYFNGGSRHRNGLKKLLRQNFYSETFSLFLPWKSKRVKYRVLREIRQLWQANWIKAK